MSRNSIISDRKPYAAATQTITAGTMTREQFEHETRALRPRLVAIAEGITGSRDEAEDIVQDVLLKLWGMNGELEPPIGAFACVVTRHAAVDRRRSAATRGEQKLTPADDRAADDGADPRAERMFAVMATLPGVQQAVLRMRLADGMEYDEIARLLRTSEQNVRQILSRARKAVLQKYSAK